MMKNHFFISFIGILILLNIIACKKDITGTEDAKADLVITKITYEKKAVSGIGVTYNFIIEVKNIGDNVVNNRFYISNTRNKWDLENDHYSASQVVNYNQKIINPGETFTDQVQDFPPKDTSIIKFKIATAGLFDEKDRSNNYYIIDLEN